MSPLEQLAEWLGHASDAVAFTGAGVSTESGIPDFRSPGGVWSQNRPVYFDEFLKSPEARFEYWRQKAIAHRDFVDAKPNAGHQTLAAWEERGLIRGVITQNIDGLHQQAGSRAVWELHGTAREIGCLNCGWRTPADRLVQQFLDTQTVPDCPECRGLLKHATISFGQPLDEQTLARASSLAQGSDLFLAIGSSLIVHPAAGLPQLAKEQGARLVIINREPTPLDVIADLVIREPIGATLAAVAKLAVGL
ncbi:MAG: SIR2 family NAD-dependent protein deacylase [Planctomycetaceae bacterium]